MITIVFFFFKTFYLWLKKILQYPTKHILADSANIKATCVDKEKESFDPIAEAQYILQKMNQEPDASDDFGLDAKHKKKITDRQWEKKLLKRIGTKEENADTDFHFWYFARAQMCKQFPRDTLPKNWFIIYHMISKRTYYIQICIVCPLIILYSMLKGSQFIFILCLKTHLCSWDFTNQYTLAT